MQNQTKPARNMKHDMPAQRSSAEMLKPVAATTENAKYLHPVLHVSVIDDLQDFLLLDGQFVWLRGLGTGTEISPPDYLHVLTCKVE